MRTNEIEVEELLDAIDALLIYLRKGGKFPEGWTWERIDEILAKGREEDAKRTSE